MKQLLAWRGMKANIKEYVQACMVCQQVKPDRSKSLGLFQPLLVPQESW
jgi:hypothetical protein